MWMIANQSDAHVELKNTTDDTRRIGVLLDPEDSDDVTAMSVYPCRECGWAQTCEDGCHS